MVVGLEIPLPQPEERGSVELGVPAHGVTHARMNLLAAAVQPALLVVVAIRLEHRVGVPVLLFPCQKRPPFQDQDAGAGAGERMGQGAAAGAAADDDHVVVHGHQRSRVSVPVRGLEMQISTDPSATVAVGGTS